MILKLLIQWVLFSFAIAIGAYYMEGVSLSSYAYAFWVAIVLASVNVTIKPILQLVTLPITIFSFGFFLLIINAFIILLVDYLLDDFSIDGFWTAVFFSLIISIVYWSLDRLFNAAEKE